MIATLPASFRLLCQCCRWPLSEAVLSDVRHAAAEIDDWDGFLLVVRRHRVAGLVANSLRNAGIDLPDAFASALSAMAARIAAQNMAAASESAALQDAFDAAGIPALFVKGSALAILAYGSLALKQSRDIDVLVPPRCAEDAVRLLEARGYSILLSSRPIGVSQRRALFENGHDLPLLHGTTSLVVELHWRLTANPMLLAGVDAASATATVSLAPGLRIRTLMRADSFAYLAAHGSAHGWSRLKWLADFNAFTGPADDEELVGLYRHAASRGAGISAASGLVLCRDLFSRALPAVLEAEFSRERRISRVLRLSRLAMMGQNPYAELDERRFARVVVSFIPFLLGRGAAFYFAQLRSMSVSSRDIITMPLPARLHFLYVMLRPAIWVWRWSGFFFGRARRGAVR